MLNIGTDWSHTLSYFRRISPAEATYLAKDRLGSGQFVNQFFIEGQLENNDEAFDEAQWREAINKAAEKNPGICLQLRGFWGFRYWKKTSLKPQLIRYTGEWDGSSSAGFESLAPYINPRTDTNASIILIDKLKGKNNSNKSLILFRIHHGLCDGAATAHWIQEVFRALKHQKLQGSVSSINETTIIKRTDYPRPDTFRGNCLPVFAKPENPEIRGCHWVKTHWSVGNQRIVARLLHVLRDIACEQHGDGKTVFRLTSDLRHYMLPHEMEQVQLSNLSGIFDIEVTNNDSVKSIQFKIIRAIRNHRDLSVFPKRMISLTPWLPGKIFNLSNKGAENLYRRGVCNITAMIGYANHIDLEAVSYKGFKATGAFAIPMNIEDKSMFLGIASNPNGIDVILLAPNAFSSIEKTHAMADKIGQILNQTEIKNEKI